MCISQKAEDTSIVAANCRKYHRGICQLRANSGIMQRATTRTAQTNQTNLTANAPNARATANPPNRNAKRAAQKIRHRRGIADCRLPIADCRLPIADCRLPIADCRLPILRQRRLRSSWFGWFVSCLFLLYYANGFCRRQKPLYPQKPEYQVFFVKKFVIPAPAYAGAGCGGNQLPQGGEYCGGESRR